MYISLLDSFKQTPEGKEADSILRTCVHCGFCLATCPTYQLLGDELDSPRGRIYLMKQMFEGEDVTEKTQLHLDRCLTCRACETTCPSGVKYGRLVDIGRGYVESRVQRGFAASLKRKALGAVLPRPSIFKPALKLGQLTKPLLPGLLQKKIPESRTALEWPTPRHARKMLILDGCVQPTLEPNINYATARVLDRLSISLIKSDQAGCCGAVAYHLNQQADGRDYMRRNIDAWWPFVESGVEAIVMTASGCGTTVKEYGHMLHNDTVYSKKAARISALTKDISEVVTAEAEGFAKIVAPRKKAEQKIAYHPPCSLQHAQKLKNIVEPLLIKMGYELTPVPDSHLCCGSAGTYSLLQPELSQRLLKNKIDNLNLGKPTLIATANIGCQSHIQSATQLPVRHWVELVAECL
jgi:glycolate oxidase iron-sulfur subunit